ncbi:Protein outspread [Aphelenchoides fujianensis]|nr:Protein outspread [Aphelenchoides fujianensis]
MRKVVASSFLYVSPPHIDFSRPLDSKKRWQRRFFRLYDDGELSFALDDLQTVPQQSMNMGTCTRVCVADAITKHDHSCCCCPFETRMRTRPATPTRSST